MTIVDLIVILLAVLAAYRGWRRGLFSQVFELGGGFLGLIAGVALGPRIAAMFTRGPGLEGALISLLVVFVLLSIGQTLGYLVGHRFRDFAHRARLRTIDSSLGSGFGVAVVVVSFWLIGSLLANGPTPGIARAFQKSRVLRATSKVMPDPPNLLAYISQYLNTSGFPQVFAGLPPGVGPPVKLPSAGDARRAAQVASKSTVRIVVPACGGTQLGSGWVAADGVVVTNAHVVAGGGDPTVEDAGGEHPGRVVLFDPDTDLAVIHTQGLAGPPLELDTARLKRGGGAAIIGFPGDRGGQQTSHRAAVSSVIDADGADIYGRDRVTREIYELRSVVRQGDSGGPFVVSGGDVAGMVFAASTTNPRVGYALTGAEISDEVDRGIDLTEPVGTGPCTH